MHPCPSLSSTPVIIRHNWLKFKVPWCTALSPLRAGRCFYVDPTEQASTRAASSDRHRFACVDPTTWPQPYQDYVIENSQYGRVQVAAWQGGVPGQGTILSAEREAHDLRGGDIAPRRDDSVFQRHATHYSLFTSISVAHSAECSYVWSLLARASESECDRQGYISAFDPVAPYHSCEYS